MKNYKLLWGVIFVLLIAIVFLSGALFISFNRYKDIQIAQTLIKDELASIQAELDLSQQANIGARNELKACEDQLSAFERKNSLFELEILSCEEDIATINQAAQENVDNLEEQVNSVRDQLSERTRELGEYRDQFNELMCDPDLVDKLNMDYSGIQASSSRLQSFVANLFDVDHISWAYRNTLWNNAYTKIHGVRYVSKDGETYSRQFLVYVDELGWEEATFYVDDQCWLDAP